MLSLFSQHSCWLAQPWFPMMRLRAAALALEAPALEASTVAHIVAGPFMRDVLAVGAMLVGAMLMCPARSRVRA